jgi:DNA-binding NtrC family response regulator
MDEHPQRVQVIDFSDNSPMVDLLPQTDREEPGEVIYRAGMTMADVEKAAIEAALRASRGNRRRAAEVLGIGERTLYRKIKAYHLDS